MDRLEELFEGIIDSAERGVPREWTANNQIEVELCLNTNREDLSKEARLEYGKELLYLTPVPYR